MSSGLSLPVDRDVALDDRPGHELDVAVDLLEREVEHDVAEAVVRALALEVAARDAQLVRRQVLVAVVVRRHDHEALAQVGDRAGVVVAERLLDEDRRLADVLPVDLVVVDAPEGGDQIAERVNDHATRPSPPARSRARLVGPDRHRLEASRAVGRHHRDVDRVAPAADRHAADARRVEARVVRPPAARRATPRTRRGSPWADTGRGCRCRACTRTHSGPGCRARGRTSRRGGRSRGTCRRGAPAPRRRWSSGCWARRTRRSRGSSRRSPATRPAPRGVSPNSSQAVSDERVRLAQAARQQPVQQLGRQLLDPVLDVALARHRPRDARRDARPSRRRRTTDALGPEVEAAADVAVEIGEARRSRLGLPALRENRALERGVRLDHDDRVRALLLRQVLDAAAHAEIDRVRKVFDLRHEPHPISAQHKNASASSERLRRHRPTICPHGERGQRTAEAAERQARRSRLRPVATKMEPMGIEPVTSALPARRSPS